MNRKNFYSINATKQIVKKEGAKEISEEAVLYLAGLAEKLVAEITRKTMPIVEHVHRKRILKKDIIFATEEFA